MNYPNLPKLCDRLVWALERSGLKQVQIAKAVGIKPPSYNQLESGRYQTSRYTAQIALVLNVDSHWLATNVIGVNEPIKRDRLVNLHIANENLPPNNCPTMTNWTEVRERAVNMDSKFKYQYEGDSMTGTGGVNIPSGAVLVVDPQAERKPGRIALADRAGYPIIGTLSSVGAETYLRPSNQQYPAVQITADSIIGIVTLIEISAP